MRKADLSKHNDRFDATIKRYRSFMEKVLDAQKVIKGKLEKRDIAESVLLRLCAHWEFFTNEHIVACINGDHSRLSEFFGVKIPRHPSKDLCHALIFNGSYRDFKSFGDLKGFSKKILPDQSNPFLKVSKQHAERIDDVYKLRNYLAHYSSVSKRSVKQLYKTAYSMVRFLEPGQFLLAHSAKRLWQYFDAFEGASRGMRKCAGT